MTQEQLKVEVLKSFTVEELESIVDDAKAAIYNQKKILAKVAITELFESIKDKWPIGMCFYVPGQQVTSDYVYDQIGIGTFCNVLDPTTQIKMYAKVTSMELVEEHGRFSIKLNYKSCGIRFDIVSEEDTYVSTGVEEGSFKLTEEGEGTTFILLDFEYQVISEEEFNTQYSKISNLVSTLKSELI